MSTVQELLSYLATAQRTGQVSSVKPQSVGASEPDVALLEDILRCRKVEEAERVVAELNKDLNRPFVEYHSIVKKSDIRSAAAHDFVDAPPMADIEGNRAVLGPLLTLLRVLLQRRRVERHLSMLRGRGISERAAATARAVGDASAPQAVSERAAGEGGSGVPCLLTAASPSPDLDHESANVMGGVYTGLPENDLSAFANYTSFQPKPLREFFRYRRNDYAPERFPEFTLRLESDARGEFEPYRAIPTPDANTVSEPFSFVQPPAVSQTYSCRTRPRNLGPLEGFYDRRAHFSTVTVNDNHDNTRTTASTDDAVRGVASTAVRTDTSLLRMPRKLHEACAADDLSGSDSGDDEPPFYQPTASWIPSTSHTVRQRPQHSNFDDGLDTFIARYV